MKLMRLLLISFITLAVIGCSADGNTPGDVSAQGINSANISDPSEVVIDSVGKINPQGTDEKRFYFTVLSDMVLSSVNYHDQHIGKRRYALEDLIATGSMSIIPRNPYIGKDIVESLNHSKGNVDSNREK